MPNLGNLQNRSAFLSRKSADDFTQIFRANCPTSTTQPAPGFPPSKVCLGLVDPIVLGFDFRTCLAAARWEATLLPSPTFIQLIILTKTHFSP